MKKQNTLCLHLNHVDLIKNTKTIQTNIDNKITPDVNTLCKVCECSGISIPDLEATYISQIDSSGTSLKLAKEAVESKPYEEFNSNNKLIKKTYYKFNDQIGKQFIDYIQEFNPETNHKFKTTFFKSNGTTIWAIYEFNHETGNKTKETIYQKDGKTFDYVNEFNPATGEKTKTITYNSDGTEKSTEDY